MHQARNIFFALLCGGLSVSAQEAGFDFSGEEVDEGFVFTDEDVAKAEEDEQEMMALIGNAAKYEQVCVAEYNKIITAFGKCFKEIQAINDELECTDHPAPADIFNKYYNDLMDIGCFSPGSGQFLEGVLNRSNLAKARAGMMEAQYVKCEIIIKRSELMMQWFTDSFRKACQSYHEDFMEMLQQSARFQLCLKQGKETMDAFYHLHKTFNADMLEERLHKIVVTFRNNDKGNSLAFFNHFHNKISSDERDRWLSYVILGGRISSSYNGPTYGVQPHTEAYAPWKHFDIRGGRVIQQPTYQTNQLIYYMKLLDKWSLSRLDTIKTVGTSARVGAGEALQALEKLIKQTENEQLMGDSAFRNIIGNEGTMTVLWMRLMVEPMVSMNDFLDKTDFKKHKLLPSGMKPLLEIYQKQVDTANRKLNDMYEFAAKQIPATHKSRQTD
jgi:hypothetical protein